jgi:hypothetical protein
MPRRAAGAGVAVVRDDPTRFEHRLTGEELTEAWRLTVTLHGLQATPEQAAEVMCDEIPKLTRYQALEILRHAFSDHDKRRAKLMTRKPPIDWSVQGRRWAS